MCVWGRDGTSWFAQLRLLLWKNWTLKKRRAGSSVCEILFPLGAVCILLMIRALVKIEDVEIQIPIQDKVMVREERRERERGRKDRGGSEAAAVARPMRRHNARGCGGTCEMTS